MDNEVQRSEALPLTEADTPGLRALLKDLASGTRECSAAKPTGDNIFFPESTSSIFSDSNDEI